MVRQYTPALSPEPRPREISERVNALIRGKFNSHGSVTLALSVATTTLTDPNIGLDSTILLSFETANAQTEGLPWYSITAAGSATLNHQNNATAGRTFGYVIVG